MMIKQFRIHSIENSVKVVSIILFVLTLFSSPSYAAFPEGSYELKDKNSGNPDLWLEHPARGSNPQINGNLRRRTVLFVDIRNADEVIDIYTSRYEGTVDIEIFGAADTTVSVATYNVLQNGDGYVGSFAEIIDIQNINTRPRAPFTFTPAQGLGAYKIILYGTGAGNDAGGVQFFDVMVRNTKNTATQIDDILRRGRLWSKHLALSGRNFNARFNAKLYMIDGNDEGSFYSGYLWEGDMNGIAPFGFHMFTNRVGAANSPNQSVNGTGGASPQFPMYFNFPEKPIVNPFVPTVSNLIFRNNCLAPGTGGTFEFTTNGNWTFEIVLDENGDGIFNRGTERTITGPATNGFNSIAWDGKFLDGTDAPNGTTISVILRAKSSEIHFPFYDVENRPGATGPTFNLVPVDNETYQYYYWDDSPIGGTNNSALGSLTPHTWNESLGNNRLVDTWKVAFEDISEYTLIYNCTDANLLLTGEVDVPRPDENQTVTYTFINQNTGPAPATNIDITLALPAGLTFQSATTTGGTYIGASQIWRIASQDVGDLDSLIITATTDNGTSGLTLNYPANITAIDQTDPDLSNNSVTVTIDVALFNLSGTVFEDPNYGGGAGRNKNASGASRVQNATVELYNASSGTLLATTTTDATGNYTFSSLNKISYIVRVVNSTISSNRVGGTLSGNVAVQTYRTNAASGTAIPVTNRVGGETPHFIDAPANTGSQNLSALTSGTLTPQSITTATFTNADISTVDFGFNFSTIVNTNDTGQGSLRQFIINSNQLSNGGLNQDGLSNTYEYSIFAIPTSDPNFNGQYFTINLASPLNNITDSFTRFDGTTQTTFTGDTHASSSELTTGPEVIINGTGLPIFNIPTSFTYITGLGFEGTSGSGVNGSAILLTGVGSTGTVIDEVTIKDNAGSGIYMQSGAAGIVIENSIIRSNGVTQNDASGITLSASSNTIIRNNVIRLNAGDGIALFANSSSVEITNNTLSENGTQSAIYQSGVGIISGDSNTISGNTIRDNAGDGVVVQGGTGNQISQNSFYDNAGLAIDLIGSNGVNLNDNNDADSGPNDLYNFPVFDEARYDGLNLILSGYSRPGANIEVYIADEDLSGFGEGRTYLTTLTEGSGSDTDGNTGSYSGAINGVNSGSDNNANRFSFTIPLPSGVNLGTKLTAIAIDGSNNTSEFSGVIEVVRNLLKGYVYLDANHNGNREIGEDGTGLTQFVKVLDGSTVVKTAPVNSTSGEYIVTGLLAGNYTVILDDNNTIADNTPTLQATYIGTEAPNQTIGPITVGTFDNIALNFGLFRGSKIEVSVINDNGAGSGTAYNATLDGTEVAIGGLTVRLTNQAGTMDIDQSITSASGQVTLWADHTWNAQTIRVESNIFGGYISVSGNVGNTAGSFDRDNRTIIFSNSSGTSYTNLVFGQVQQNSWIANMVRESLPGTSVYIPHVFTANNSAGVSFTPTLTPTPNVNGWSVVLYRDQNADGILQNGEPQITAPINVAPSDQIHVLAKVTISNVAPIGGSAALRIEATSSLVGTLPQINNVYEVNDLINVNQITSAGLELVKSVDKNSALPGELLTYTITYKNVASDAITTIIINDATPPYTTYNGASFGPLPSGISNCVISAPSVGGTGAISWTFTGSLASGATGTITYVVQIDN